MSIAETEQIFSAELWPQGDARDPLGIWGGRHLTVGDATGGETKVTFFQEASQRSAYVYTCHAVTIAHLTGASVAQSVGIRLLTNWPNIDPQAGVQGFSTGFGSFMRTSGDFTTPPIAQIEANNLGSLQYVILFDPRQSGINLDLVELKHSENLENSTYSFEVYGYFWDREVMNTPGGLRHPGSS